MENNKQFKREKSHKLDEYLEEGSLAYTISEYSKTGLIYKYGVNRKASHKYRLEEVLIDEYLYYDTFVISNEFRALYFQQKLEWIETILEKRKEEF